MKHCIILSCFLALCVAFKDDLKDCEFDELPLEWVYQKKVYGLVPVDPDKPQGGKMLGATFKAMDDQQWPRGSIDFAHPRDESGASVLLPDGLMCISNAILKPNGTLIYENGDRVVVEKRDYERFVDNVKNAVPFIPTLKNLTNIKKSSNVQDPSKPVRYYLDGILKLGCKFEPRSTIIPQFSLSGITELCKKKTKCPLGMSPCNDPFCRFPRGIRIPKGGALFNDHVCAPSGLVVSPNKIVTFPTGKLCKLPKRYPSMQAFLDHLTELAKEDMSLFPRIRKQDDYVGGDLSKTITELPDGKLVAGCRYVEKIPDKTKSSWRERTLKAQKKRDEEFARYH